MCSVRVAYVIYNERPLSGLIRTQVISLLKEVKRQAPEFDLTLISFWQPWVAVKFKKELAQLRGELSASGIQVEDYPWAVIPSRHFLYSVKLFPILHWWGRQMFRRALGKRFEIVHCRSYFASLIAAELKQELGYRCVFDMRSLWPKEHVTIGAFTMQDEIYRMWERLERKTIEQSDASVGVSVAMIEDISRIAPGARRVLIPICVDTREFYFDERARVAMRREHNWDSRLVVAYQGSLGLLNRNIHNVADYFTFLQELRPDAYFLVLTSGTGAVVADIMEQHGVKPSHFLARESPPSELRRWLSAADVGIHVMARGPDSPTRLGVKFVEYLSCGLPVIVNANVGAAAELVNVHRVGAVIDLEQRQAAQRNLEQLLGQSDLVRQRCRRVAEELFSVEACARKYLDLYRTLQN